MAEICGHGFHRDTRDPYDLHHAHQYHDEYSLVLPSNIIQGFSNTPVHFTSSAEADSPPGDDSSTYTWSAPGSSGSPAPQSDLHSYSQAMEIRPSREADYPSYSFPSMAFNTPLPSTYVNPPPYSGTTMPPPPPPRPLNYRTLSLDYPSHALHNSSAYQAPSALLSRDQEDHYQKQQQTLHHQQQQQHSARCLAEGPWRLESMPAEVLFQILSILWQDLKWAKILHLRGTSRHLRSVVMAWEVSMNPEELRLGKDCYIMEMERDCSRFYPLNSNRAGPPATRPSKARGREAAVVDEGPRWQKPRIPGALGCYSCHSIRHPDAFEKSSLMPEVDPEEKAAKKAKSKAKGRAKGKGKKGVASASSSPISAASEDFTITTTHPSSPTDFSAAASTRGQSPPSIMAGGRRSSSVSKVRSRDRMPNTRRYCIDCGIKMGFYRPGDLIYNVPGRRTWVCSCLVVQYDPETPCRVCANKPPLSQKEPETPATATTKGSFSPAEEHSVGYHSPQ